MCTRNKHSYDRLEHLRRALFWEPNRLVMIVTAMPFTAHADDSGKRDTPLVIVGGYLAESAQWELLQKLWLPKVRKKGLPEFKRSDYDEKKLGREFLSELGDLIHRYAVYGFAYGIYCEDWLRVSKKYALELYHLVPYSICARTCIGAVREWSFNHQMKSEHMAYIFDKGSEDAGELIELLKIDESEDARKVVKSLTSGDSEEIAGLQASDYLAWEIRNQFLANPDPKGWDELTKELAHLLRVPFDANALRMPKFGFYREKDLENLCQRAKVPLLSDIPNDMWAKPKPIRLKWPATKP